ncbi:hypothetical protein [Burkholderia sp. Ac-20349]|uniref:hypothetical protein n=1 Tax=Burkholderia sp. Ac-20349 TaxID=2703893 RepID=UPI00197B9ABE|nr:hypothetical protein [Burkholderia sp. Ac-20349]MBN3839224.1 hypothetical protein [Burkholderia sp. Ac-20349]
MQRLFELYKLVMVPRFQESAPANEPKPMAYLVRWANGEQSLKFPGFFLPGMRARAIERGAEVIALGPITVTEKSG